MAWEALIVSFGVILVGEDPSFMAWEALIVRFEIFLVGEGPAFMAWEALIIIFGVFLVGEEEAVRGLEIRCDLLIFEKGLVLGVIGKQP